MEALIVWFFGKKFLMPEVFFDMLVELKRKRDNDYIQLALDKNGGEDLSSGISCYKWYLIVMLVLAIPTCIWLGLSSFVEFNSGNSWAGVFYAAMILVVLYESKRYIFELFHLMKKIDT